MSSVSLSWKPQKMFQKMEGVEQRIAERAQDPQYPRVSVLGL